MGAGKTAALGEASDILSQRRLVHAAIDLDSLGLVYLPSRAPSDAVMYENLRAIYGNYANAGVQRFLVARAIESETQLKLCCKTIPAGDTVVCRLVASLQVMQRRVENRESGAWQRRYIERVEKLSNILDEARLEDFTVSNENRPLTDVATEMLVKAGWISD
jgi:hypothetical protein